MAASGWEFFTFGVPGDDGLYPEGVRDLSPQGGGFAEPWVRSQKRTEVATDSALVRSLLETQHPDLSGLALEELTAGFALAEYGAAPRARWLRARAWAVLFGVLLLDNGLADNPRHAKMGELTLHRITEGP